MASAAYFRAWRDAHPEYRARDNRRRTSAKRLRPRDRRVEYARRPSRAIPPLPACHQGHPLFDLARAVVGQDRSVLTVLHDPLYDDLISVATLAILRDEDASAAVRQYRAAEMRWRGITCALVAT